MKAVAVLLLVLSVLTVSHGWTCKAGPQQLNAAQIDAGDGKVVMTDRNSNVYVLCGSTWFRVGSVPLKHVSVGPAGIWGVDTSDKVYKYVAGNFIVVNGQTLQQVDAGGEGQVVGVTSSSSIHCLRSTAASTYSQVGSVGWNGISGRMVHFSCSQLGCWAVGIDKRIYFITVTPTTCDTSGWRYISDSATMVEVGSDGSVFYVDNQGFVYQRTGVSKSLPYGGSWTRITQCLPTKHVSYDQGKLWLVSKGGIITECTR